MKSLVFALAFVTSAATPAAAPRQHQQPTAEQKRAMAEQLQPGAPHRELATLEGQWTQEVTYNMGARPMKGRGTTTNRMVLGGRFLVSERTSMTAAGATGGFKVDAMSIYGFDRRTNEYTIVELDTMGTYWVTAAGAPREDRSIVMSGETLDDHGGAREMRTYDMVLRVIDADTYVTEIIFRFAGRPPAKLVETLHRRIK
jgi:hypothetical protein